MVKNRAIIILSVVLFTIACVVIFTRTNSSAGLQVTFVDPPVDMDEPIAFIGHGAMFDRQGNEIEPSPKFLKEAQVYYLDKLTSLATSEQRAQLRSKQASLYAETDLNVRDQMIVNSALIDWLIDGVQLADAGALQGKNNFIRGMIRDLYPSVSDYPMDGESELSSFLDSQGLLRSSNSSSETAEDSSQYIKECIDAGVPEPPGWGDPRWKDMGPLDPHLLFIQLEGDNRTNWPNARAYVYESQSPKGLCMALPRIDKSNKVIGLLGIVCMGQESSKACYWDNQVNGKTFTLPVGANRDIADFAGGKQLFGGSGGICTDCHAGENAFVIHPDRLNPPNVGSLLLPNEWHKPMVDSRWPQNPGPSPTLNDGACMSCHNGRILFPDITKDLVGYCKVVLQNSISQPRQTMPFPGGDLSPYADHIRQLETACQLPLSSMSQSTIKVNNDESCSARSQKFTVELRNRLDDKVENVQVTGNFENLTLNPASFKLKPGSGVSGPNKPTITGNTFTWAGDFEGKTQITIEYTAWFGGDAPEGTLGTSTVSIEDGIGKVVLSESANAPKPPQPPPPPPPLPPGLSNFVYLPITQWKAGQCPPPVLRPRAEHSVRITGIGLENGRYVVDYETSGYTEQLPGRHVHFYFDTVPESEAGVPGKGPWILYGGPRPFTQYGVADRPEQATAMCARVANEDHSIILGSGNCYPLPDPYSVNITSIGLENGSYVVNYETSGYTEQLPGRHVHFYFNTVPEAEAGKPGNGPWILYGGPRPFTQYGVSDRPAQATEMCARVANTDHSIIHGSGNCYPLPDPDPTTVTLQASKDNTLYNRLSSVKYHNECGLELSNGKGEHFFTGIGSGGQDVIPDPPEPADCDPRPNRPVLRRGVLAFDLDSIPSGAEILKVTLKLNLTKASRDSGDKVVSLHTLNKDWGEGASEAGGGEGRGALAVTGDATWRYSNFNSIEWTSAGGDFNAAPSGSKIVGTSLVEYSWSSDEAANEKMKTDVQNWLENPSSNFGWLLKGEEEGVLSARAFASHENQTEGKPPKLIVEYNTKPADYAVSITGIGLDNGRYVVDYETSGYTEQLPGRHVHFYFDTVAEADAGVPGNGPWILYGGPRPFTQYGVSDRPTQANAMCARVAEADHSIIFSSGNCFPLP